MIISINSNRTPPPPHWGTFSHLLRPAGALLAVFATSLLLTACPSPDGGKPTPKPKAWHVTTFAGSGENDFADGIGTAAEFSLPYGIAQSGDTLYVIDRSAHSLRTVHTATARVGTIVHGGGIAGAYVDGAGTSARFSFPTDVAAAAGSTLYVADSGNNRIREVRAGAAAAATRVSTLAGSGTSGHAEGAGNAAQFSRPAGLALSGDTLYVADQNNHRIRAIDLASADKTVSTIAGSTQGYADHATGTNAQFNSPSGLAVSKDGSTLYVADFSNHRIRAINLASADKTVSTIAGSGASGHANGAGAAAQFNEPLGLAINDGTLYVADSNNHRIRAIDIASTDKTVRTIADDGTKESKNGIGTAARFDSPTGIAVSGDTLYVATQGRRIRKLVPREVGS